VSYIQACIEIARQIQGGMPTTHSATSVYSFQLRWSKEDEHGDLHRVLSSLRESHLQSSFDAIVCADCLFFKDFHEDLLWTIKASLDPKVGAKCFLLQPRRSGTMDMFLSLVYADDTFDVDIQESYCPTITSMHREYLNAADSTYNADIHYPILIILTRRTMDGKHCL
jgi:calmodulin-lysine N-methyltransferase